MSVSPPDYSPLKLDEIRLGVLEPKIDSMDVSFSVMRVNVNDAPSFEALSYCWGDHNNNLEIKQNNGPLPHDNKSLCRNAPSPS